MAVATGLARLGHRVDCWFGADLPLELSASFNLSTQDALTWRARGPDIALDTPCHDTVWNRRHNAPHVNARDIHPDDRVFVERELRLFDLVIRNAALRCAFEVNPAARFEIANSKLAQLVAAREAGFVVPATLISNDPGDIRDFVARHRANGVVYKSFTPGKWKLDDGGRSILPATAIDLDALPEDPVLRLTPGIFQTRIDKAFELRVTVIGHEAIAARIDAPAGTHGSADWRDDIEGAVRYSAATLPETVRRRCLDVMHRLGIVFGCFDLIVTPEGETVFLEVNEMGQFLWVETRLPDLPLLDMFCRFLVERRADFRYSPPTGGRLAWGDMPRDEDYLTRLEHHRARHVDRHAASAGSR